MKFSTYHAGAQKASDFQIEDIYPVVGLMSYFECSGIYEVKGQKFSNRNIEVSLKTQFFCCCCC